MNKKLFGALVVSAIALGNIAPVHADNHKGQCSGVNGCKGQGACGGAGHECAGKNACKGKGWLEMSEKDCKAKHGTYKKG